MRIVFTKLTDDRHRLTIVRDDASTESIELETRSFLLHDLVHYAVEAEAGIDDGFWGLLARGTTLADLKSATMEKPISPGIVRVERLVGPMQSVWNERIDPSMTGIPMDLIERVRVRLRALTGHWRATKFREAMEIRWPPEPSTMAP